MENNINTFKDAIDISLAKLGYDKTDYDIIKKLIVNAINGNPNYFTRSNGARLYVENKIVDNDSLLKEIIDSSKTVSTDLDSIINDYIAKFFAKNDSLFLRQKIKENSDFKKVLKKIRHININSQNDEEFINNMWNLFCNIFKGHDKNISKEELRFDMIEAALELAEKNRENVQILKDVKLTDKELNLNDVIYLTEKNIYNNSLEDLLIAIDHNQILSGLLMQNLLDYVYFEKEMPTLKDDIMNIDKYLENLDMSLKNKANILKEIINGNRNDLDKNKVMISLIKNSLCLNMYTDKKISIDYEERKLYEGESNLEEKPLQSRIENNSKIINNFLYGGTNISIDDVVNIFNNLTDKEIYFLTNIFVISRSTTENKQILNNQLVIKNEKNKTHLLGILENPNLIEKMNESNEIIKY